MNHIMITDLVVDVAVPAIGFISFCRLADLLGLIKSPLASCDDSPMIEVAAVVIVAVGGGCVAAVVIVAVGGGCVAAVGGGRAAVDIVAVVDDDDALGIAGGSCGLVLILAEEAWNKILDDTMQNVQAQAVDLDVSDLHARS